MGRTRAIRKILKGKPTIEGAGVHLKRVFGFGEVTAFDPFLLLDGFRFDIQRDSFAGNGTIVLFDDGDEIEVFTDRHEVRFLLISGKPIREPVAWYGPIVMNTQEELRTAFDEYRKGTFIRYKG